MFRDEKSLKDFRTSQEIAIKDKLISISHTKSSKLISALFMVTDIMDSTEPLRSRLRTLGVEIISDIYTKPTSVESKIQEIVSFLDIALTVNLISEMNANILRKEFLMLLESVKNYLQARSGWIGDLLSEPDDVETTGKLVQSESFSRNQSLRTYKGHTSTRIGVQKGSTLMKALKDIKLDVSDKSHSVVSDGSKNYDMLKKARREDIISILKTDEQGFTITDIKIKAKGLPDKFSALISCGEKTLQRELVSMVRDGVLKKMGEKRWSRYSIN